MTHTPRTPEPLRWLAHLPIAVLPFLAAAALEGPRLSATLEARAASSLAAAGLTWAKPEADGRDLMIRGTAPGRAAAAQALAVAEAIPGVRRAELRVLALGD